MKTVVLLLAVSAVALGYDQKTYNGQQAVVLPATIPGRVNRPQVLPAQVPGRQNYNNGGINQQQYGNQGFNNGRGNNQQRPSATGTGYNRGSLTKPLYPPQQQQNFNRPAGGQNKPLYPQQNNQFGGQGYNNQRGNAAFNQQPQKNSYSG